jgi:hypothetical protein
VCYTVKDVNKEGTVHVGSIVQIQLDDNEYIVKAKAKEVKKQPNYFMAGNGTMSKYKIKSIDLLEEVMTVSKAAQFVIRLIKSGITHETDYNPAVKISRKTLTKSEQNYLDKGYKELVGKDLVRRVKQGHYMINPNALIPPEYDKAVIIWENIL